MTVVELASEADDLVPALAAVYRGAFAEPPYEEGEVDVDRFVRSQRPAG